MRKGKNTVYILLLQRKKVRRGCRKSLRKPIIKLVKKVLDIRVDFVPTVCHLFGSLSGHCKELGRLVAERQKMSGEQAVVVEGRLGFNLRPVNDGERDPFSSNLLATNHLGTA